MCVCLRGMQSLGVVRVDIVGNSLRGQGNRRMDKGANFYEMIIISFEKIYYLLILLLCIWLI